MRARRLLLSAVLFALGACATHPPAHQHAARSDSTPPPLFDNLGTYSQRITTSSPQAQAYFDQGLRLVYGFNHAEAQRAFREAARLDPDCAMCSWGIALTYGSNYNSPTDVERERGAWEAVQKARALAVKATAAGARHHRGAGGAPLCRSQGRPCCPRSRVCRCHAPGGASVPRRSRRGHLLRRRHDEPAALAPVDAGREARTRDGRDRCRPSSVCSPPIQTIRAPSISTSTPWRPVPSRSAGRPRPTVWSTDAGCRPPGPHALAHLLPRGALRGCRDGERARRAGRPRVLRGESAERDLPHGVLSPQPRLHLALGQHGGAQRGDAARRARTGGGDAPRDDAPDVGYGERPGSATLRAGPLRAMGRDPARTGAGPGVALRHRGLALRARARLRGLRPARTGPRGADGAEQDRHHRVPRADHRELLQDRRHVARWPATSSPARSPRGPGIRPRRSVTSPRPSRSRTGTGSRSRRPGTTRCASPSARPSCRAGGRPRRRRSTARICSGTRTTAGRCSA